MSKALVPISVIADNICAGMGDSTGKYKFTMLRHILSGYRELNLFLNQDFSVKTAILEFDNVVKLCDDFVYETKVGMLYKGHLAVLSLDKNVRPQKLSQLEAERHFESIFAGEFWGDVFPFYNVFRGSQFLGELYGFGRGVHAPGYYNIDRKNGEIQIGSLVPKGAEIVVEYKSDGISDGLKLVPSETEMCISYWAKARFYEEKEKLTLAQYNEAEYERHYNKLKRLYNFQSALYASAELNKSFSPSNY